MAKTVKADATRRNQRAKSRLRLSPYKVALVTMAVAIAPLTATTLLTAPAGATTGTTLTVTGTADATGSCSSGTCPSLRAAVAYADANPSVQYTIVLPRGYYHLTDSVGSTLDVATPSPLAIEGSGAGTTVIEAGGEAGFDTELLYVADASTVSISKLTLSGGVADYGGDVYNTGSLTITAATVTDGFAWDDGGGIYNEGTLNLGAGSVISDNAAPDDEGAGVFNDGGTVSATGAMFSGNGAYYGGALYNTSGTVDLASSTFTGNHADTEGAIYNTGTMTVTGSTFTGNAAYEDGGAIYNDGTGTLTISTSSFTGNSVYKYGGAIENTGTMTVTGSTFTGNAATDEDGGAIFNDGTLSVGTSNFTGNSTDDAGGAIDNTTGTVTITGTTFKGNAAYEDGGAIYNDENLTLKSSTLDGNSAYEYGGAIYNGETLWMTNDTVAGNSVYEYGGGVYNTSTSTSIVRAAFDTFAANVDYDFGYEAVYNGGIFYATSDIFAYGNGGSECGSKALTSEGGNVADDGSCGLTTPSDHQTVDPELMPLAANGATGAPETMAIASATSPAVNTITGVCTALTVTLTVDENNAPRPSTITGTTGCDAGAYQLQYAPGAFPTSKGFATTIEVNTESDLNTAATACAPGTETAAGCSFREAVEYVDDNTATSYTIALPAGYYRLETGDTPDVTTSAPLTIAGSGASSTVVEGGGTAGYDARLLDLTPGATVHIARLTLSGGVATYGGDIYNDDAVLALSGSTVTDGYAVYGGGIYNDDGKLTVGPASVLSDDTSPGEEGGAVYNDRGTLVATHATFSGNMAYEEGGAIYNTGNIDLKSSTFSGDHAVDGEGGAVYDDSAIGFVTGSTFTGNWAYEYGGAIDSTTTSSLAVTSSTFVGNSTSDYGGAVYAEGSEFDVSSSTFTGNSAGEYGGAVYVTEGGTSNITDSTFTGNAANDAYGGALYDEGSMIVRGSTFDGNFTYEYGGAVYVDTTMTLSDSTVEGNGAIYDGGALYNDTLTSLTNDTIGGNTVYEKGGAIYNVDTLRSAFVTFSANSDYDYGDDAVYNDATFSAASDVFAYGAGTSECTSSITSRGGNVSDDASCGLTTTSDHETVDAQLLPIGPNGGPAATEALNAGSPAINTTSTCSVSSDERGAPRPSTVRYTTGCDAGAYQVGSSPAPPSSSPTPISTPSAPTAPPGSTSHESCTAASGSCKATNATVTALATGAGSLTVAQYSANPVGQPSFAASGQYFDVKVSSTNTFSTLNVKDCNLNGGSTLHWWDAATSSWDTVTPLTGPSGTPPCLSATLSSTSSPTISQLTGTVFVAGASEATRVAGATPDATAAAELTRAFAYSKGTCPASGAAVVATTKTFQDALSSQFLAESLTTGTLLTPPTSLAGVTAATLKDEGISTVYLVGGSLAITTAVAAEIAALPAYGCGGTTPTGAKITVKRLAGPTQYGTAMAVAEQVGTAGSLAFGGAYAATNATGGTGKYNDTAAKGSSAPSGSVPTAILASGLEFQDAQAASVIAYHTKLPLLLTPATTLSTTAVGAIEKLGVKQVILVGGPLAVTNTVEAALVAKTGVSVVRVAGKDATDTAGELARFEAAGGASGLGWTTGHRAMVARGNGFTDGLAGAVLENSHNTATGASGTVRPLLLTENPTSVGSYLTTFLKVTGHGGIDGTASDTITSLTVLGGTLAVSPALLSALETDLAH